MKKSILTNRENEIFQLLIKNDCELIYAQNKWLKNVNEGIYKHYLNTLSPKLSTGCALDVESQVTK